MFLPASEAPESSLRGGQDLQACGPRANLQILLPCCGRISFSHISLSKILFSVTEPFNFLLSWLNILTRINEAPAYLIRGIRRPV